MTEAVKEVATAIIVRKPVVVHPNLYNAVMDQGDFRPEALMAALIHRLDNKAQCVGFVTMADAHRTKNATAHLWEPTHPLHLHLPSRTPQILHGAAPPPPPPCRRRPASCSSRTAPPRLLLLPARATPPSPPPGPCCPASYSSRPVPPRLLLLPARATLPPTPPGGRRPVSSSSRPTPHHLLLLQAIGFPGRAPASPPRTSDPQHRRGDGPALPQGPRRGIPSPELPLCHLPCTRALLQLRHVAAAVEPRRRPTSPSSQSPIDPADGGEQPALFFLTGEAWAPPSSYTATPEPACCTCGMTLPPSSPSPIWVVGVGVGHCPLLVPSFLLSIQSLPPIFLYCKAMTRCDRNMKVNTIPPLPCAVHTSRRCSPPPAMSPSTTVQSTPLESPPILVSSPCSSQHADVQCGSV
ncbi:vegetative cell wall protein gp1 [Triticum aestivum]|uniref:vegetative cell wall protein gp1 n=1 Tax=Triticum aestivum TaxID=4565 RepID=UPI001D021D8C|nr:vegetative cell wall protein gp1-like [Triticum aestivum]